MTPYRALSLALAVILAFSTVLVDGNSAHAQSTDETTQEAEAAQTRAEAAQGLVDATVANRAALELDLLNTITRINELSDELSALSVGLDRIIEQLAFADIELEGIEADIELRAVDAYMSALGGTSMAVVNSDSVEEALVTGLVVGDLIDSNQEAIDGLFIKKNGLEELRADFITQQEAVAAKRAEFDSQTERLALLVEDADAAVAEAIRAANAANQAYRAALSSVEVAQAKAAERERQEAKATTTTSTSPTSSTTTTSSGSGTTATTSPPPSTTTTTTQSGGGGSWTPPPAVERWRSLVSQHFPANRVDEALHIISCESNGDPDAYNPYSDASGLFQFIPETWATASPAAGYAGASPFDPVANIATAAWLANRYQEMGQYYWTAWNCKRVLN